MKRLIFLFYLRIKSAFSSLPGILGVTVCFSVIAALICFAGARLLYSEDTREPMNVALVLPEDSESYTLTAFTFINEIDTVKEYCSFNEMDEDAAFNGLRDGSVDAIVLVPDKFIEHIMNGTNTPAKVILPKSGTTSSSPLFRELVQAGVGDLAVAQAGIYAVDDVCVKYGIKQQIAEAELYLNETYLSYALNRTVCFKKTTLSSTGSLSLVQFYVCTGITLVLILSSVACLHLLAPEEQSLSSAFTRAGIPSCAVQTSKTFGVSLIYYTIFAFLIICGLAVSASSKDFASKFRLIFTDFTPIHFLIMFLVIFTSFCLAQTILSVSSNLIANVTLLFLLTIIMSFMAGGIIPAAFLPELIQKAAGFIPVTWILRLWGDILSGTINAVNILANIIICCICTGLQVILSKIKS